MKATYKMGVIGILAFFLFLTDRVFKVLAQKGIVRGNILGWGDWFQFRLTYNSGVAFGIHLNYYFIIVFYLIVIFVLIWYIINLYKTKSGRYLAVFASTLVLLGAISNLFDRIQIGQVIDYLYLKNFSIFNLADAMITVGAVILIIISGRKSSTT
ncbi:MAG: signal peptidase II [Patescibacteria group bacterium]|jgi:signal peptidase II